MRRAQWVFAAATCAAMTGLSENASAFCGFYVAGADAKLFNNATSVVMMRDRTRTVLAMQNNYQGPPESFAMVVPVPVVLQKENVRTLAREVFDRVDQMAAPRLVEYWEQDPCAEAERDSVRRSARAAPAAEASPASNGPALGVKIEAQFAVGEYEVVVLSANDSLGLDTWLRQEKYKIPDGAEPLLRPYVAAGSKFFVAKVDATKVRFEKGMATLSPLRFHYDSDAFSLPVRLGLINSGGTQDLLVHVFARHQRYDVANYPNVTIPTNFDVADKVRDRFGAFYAALFDETVRKHPGAVVTEYSWQATSCDPCPGPTLQPTDLVTLGADVLPSVMEEPMQPVIQVTLTSESQKKRPGHQWMIQSKVYPCWAEALKANRNAKGAISVAVTRGATKVAGSGDFPTKELAACIERAGADLGAGLGEDTVVAEVSLQSAPSWNAFADFVLTRLHARYGKDALGEDLVFRAAEPIVGGREVRDKSRRLETSAQKSSFNNFQGRYAIRHPWKGPATCANAKFGVWGGPPKGEQGSTQPKAVRDTAFAPRDATLASFLAQDVPELGVRPESPASRGCGGCRAAEGGASGAGAAAALSAALLLRLRRRRARPSRA